VGRHLVALSTGIHIVRLVRKKEAHVLQPFDEEVQKLILDKLKREVVDRERKRMLEDLHRRAQIKISEPDR
jgi:hypothetical protein